MRDERGKVQSADEILCRIAGNISIRNGFSTPGSNNALAPDEMKWIDLDGLAGCEIPGKDANTALIPNGVECGLHRFDSACSFDGVINAAS